MTYIFNFILQVNTYIIKSDKVDKKVRIVFLSDLHNSKYGKFQKKLIRKIQSQKPDVILLGGDFVEDYKGNENAFELIEKLSKEYPCYYVAGNHEYRSGNINAIKQKIRQCGAVVLEGEGKTIDFDGQKINICGVDDYYIEKNKLIDELDTAISQVDDNYYTVLISHRPEIIELYSEYNFDLVLSGHAHGGQWRVPVILEHGLVTPDIKFLPKFTTGKRILNNTTQIVSRGLSKFTPPFPRIFNFPEIIVVDIIPEWNNWHFPYIMRK